MLTFGCYLLEEALNESVSASQLKALQNDLRKRMEKAGLDLGITFVRHFFDRAIERSKEDDITIREIRDILTRAVDIYGKPMDDNAKGKVIGHFIDSTTLIDVPFVIQRDTSGKYDMVLLPKTIVRRRADVIARGSFKDGGHVLPVK